MIPPATWRGSLANTTVLVEATEPHDVERVGALLSRYFAVADSVNPAHPTIRLVLGPSESVTVSQQPALGGEPIAAPSSLSSLQTSCLRQWRSATGVTFRTGESEIAVDQRTGIAVGVLGEDFWSESALVHRGFLLVVLLALLESRGRYGLHANAVDGAEGGVLIVGDSGSGKTTLTLGLVQQGWHFVADDAVVLVRDPPPGRNVSVLAVRRSVSCGEETARHFSRHWAGSPHALAAVQDDGKRLLDLEAAHPGRSRFSCRPRLIVFPEITERHRSVLAPLDKTQAIIRLLAQFALAFQDRERAADQLDHLRGAVAQATTCRLLLGGDVHSAPASVSALLRDAMLVGNPRVSAHSSATSR